MDLERLKQLFAAFGADARRWPAPERDEGVRLSSGRDPQEAEAASELDRLLDAWVVDAASLDLRQRILSQAPGIGRSAWRSVGLWVQGACLAAACAAGVLAGVSLGQIGRGGADHDTEAVAAAYDAGTIAAAPADSETT